MSVNKLLVTIIDLLAMGFVLWFFLMKNEKQVEATDAIEVIVEGGYTPQNIIIQKGKTTKLTFFRKDPNACLEEVVLGDFHIRKYLPLHKKVTIELKPQEPGTFTYSCGMNMYHGKIVVR